MAGPLGSEKLLERVEDVALVVEIAAAVVADLQPPTAEWAGQGTTPAEAGSRTVMPGTREHAVIVRTHMSAMIEISREAVAASRLLDGRRRCAVAAARHAVDVCERARRERHS